MTEKFLDALASVLLSAAFVMEFRRKPGAGGSSVAAWLNLGATLGLAAETVRGHTGRVFIAVSAIYLLAALGSVRSKPPPEGWLKRRGEWLFWVGFLTTPLLFWTAHSRLVWGIVHMALCLAVFAVCALLPSTRARLLEAAAGAWISALLLTLLWPHIT